MPRVRNTTPYQYLRSVSDPTVFKTAGYLDLSAQVDEDYELVIGRLPDNMRPVDRRGQAEKLNAAFISIFQSSSRSYSKEYRRVVLEQAAKIREAAAVGDWENAADMILELKPLLPAAAGTLIDRIIEEAGL